MNSVGHAGDDGIGFRKCQSIDERPVVTQDAFNCFFDGEWDRRCVCRTLCDFALDSAKNWIVRGRVKEGVNKPLAVSSSRPGDEFRDELAILAERRGVCAFFGAIEAESDVNGLHFCVSLEKCCVRSLLVDCEQASYEKKCMQARKMEKTKRALYPRACASNHNTAVGYTGTLGLTLFRLARRKQAPGTCILQVGCG